MAKKIVKKWDFTRDSTVSEVAARFGLTLLQAAIVIAYSEDINQTRVAERVGADQGYVSRFLNRHEGGRRALLAEAGRQIASASLIGFKKLISLVDCGDKGTELKAAKWLAERGLGVVPREVHHHHSSDEREADIVSRIAGLQRELGITIIDVTPQETEDKETPESSGQKPALPAPEKDSEQEKGFDA